MKKQSKKRKEESKKPVVRIAFTNIPDDLGFESGRYSLLSATN